MYELLFIDEYEPGYPGYILFANPTSFYFYVYDDILGITSMKMTDKQSQK